MKGAHKKFHFTIKMGWANMILQMEKLNRFIEYLLKPFKIP